MKTLKELIDVLAGELDVMGSMDAVASPDRPAVPPHTWELDLRIIYPGYHEYYTVWFDKALHSLVPTQTDGEDQWIKEEDLKVLLNHTGVRLVESYSLPATR